jgi:hypothetical protein
MSAYKDLYEECLTQLIANEHAKDHEEAVLVFDQIKREMAACECCLIGVEEVLYDYGLDMDYAELFVL